VFGVLEVILRDDPVPGPSFGAGQGQLAFIVSLGVLSVHRLGAEEPGRFIWAWLRRRRFRFRNVFHVGPCVAPAEAGRRSFEELSIWALR